jgi:hypothetical protein
VLKNKPLSTIFVEPNGKDDLFECDHEVIHVVTKKERWCIDLTGRQYGFSEILSPWPEYVRNRLTTSLHPDGIHIIPIPFDKRKESIREELNSEDLGDIMSTIQWLEIEKVSTEFIENRIKADRKNFNIRMLKGSEKKFHKNLNQFLGELKACLKEYVQTMYNEAKKKQREAEFKKMVRSSIQRYSM